MNIEHHSGEDTRATHSVSDFDVIEVHLLDHEAYSQRDDLTLEPLHLLLNTRWLFYDCCFFENQLIFV